MYTGLALFYILYERKLWAWFQCRLGPMRVGKWGLLQVFADMFKILIKELICLKGTDRFLFKLAPYIIITSSVTMLACLPWGNGLQVIDFNIGIFFLLAVSSVGVLGILLAGWASNNKYTLIGAMRSGAQMISYELSLTLALMSIVVLSGTMSISEIVADQENGWYLFRGHISAVIAFIIYIIAATAETNRGPFDLPEAEHELTAGYHTEYSGIHFGFFYLAEYLNLFIVSGVASFMFLGGWMPLIIPGWEGFNNVMMAIPGPVWFLAKAFFISFVIIWFKWTFPRVRIDQMLAFEWKYLMPFSLANLVLMALFVALGWHF
ncbi:MAG: NADH-quinone oxidoreductase subunit NuoH, partial [Muribaculaceae bacterium]|nr:NADH-quinone oxidoreductase subunit NuoH [Muribaculaceae bacterium]